MKLLVNAPTGLQEIIEVKSGGEYFDESRVLWDEELDGQLPEITLGGMKRVGNSLVFDQTLFDNAHNSALINAKAAKNIQINIWRAQANSTTFPHAGKLVSCDQLSRSDIDGVAGSIALSDSFPAGFPMAWKAVDNSYIILPDKDAFKAMYASMVNQGSINFARAQTLKVTLASATTLEQVNNIVW